MLKISTVIKTLSLTILVGATVTAVALSNSSITNSSAININGKYESDIPWEAKDLNGDGHLDVTEIPWNPFEKYENGHVIEKDGTHNYGFDYDENENFIFKVPSTYFDLDYHQKTFATIESKDYYEDVLKVRKIANALQKFEGTPATTQDTKTTYKVSNAVEVDGIKYKIFDMNRNGKFDLYSEEKGYTKDETYDRIIYEDETGTRITVYQLCERISHISDEYYDEDFGWYREVRYWNGKNAVTTWTRPTKYAITSAKIERWRDIAFNNYVTWYGDDSDYAKSVREEENKKQNEMQDAIDTWREEDGSMSEIGASQTMNNKDSFYNDLFKQEIKNYSHSYDIDEACYILMRQSGASGKDALEACGVQNLDKAFEKDKQYFIDNKNWFKEKYEYFSSSTDFGQSITNTYENFDEWWNLLFDQEE